MTNIANSATPNDGSVPELIVQGRIATLRLNRPARANRIEPQDVAVLRRHLETIRTDADVRSVILTGSGKYFSSGYQIEALIESPSPDSAFPELVDALEALPQITLCALNGGVFGGSTDLALACDFRFGTAECTFRMPAVRLGVHYYPNGLRRYVSRLGLAAAKRMFLLGQDFDAKQMLDLGFLDAIIPKHQLMDHCLSVAESAAQGAPLASAGMKGALNAIARGDFDAEKIQRSADECRRSADLREGLAAWRDRRPPLFRGC